MLKIKYQLVCSVNLNHTYSIQYIWYGTSLAASAQLMERREDMRHLMHITNILQVNQLERETNSSW